MNSPYATDQTRWNALLQRDHEADGVFFYGVLTTLIYCRPNCSSKRPNHENVCYFDTWEQAERAGFRPCKRCNPRSSENIDQHAETIIKACRIMDNAEEHISLKTLAAQLGLSAFHFQRLFKKVTGITPKQYAMQKRSKQVRTRLIKGASVTDAIFEAGFASSSRFYENAVNNLGMKPSQYRKGATGIRIRIAVVKSDLGWVLIGATEKGICTIELGDNPDVLRERLFESFPRAVIQEGDNDLNDWVKQLLIHIENPSQRLNLPLDIQGTAFQRQVWQALREIPVGSTASYTEIAEKIGKPKAARAVANACASNKLAIAVPCHRVVRKNGLLGGYRWGAEKKRMVLDKETG
jgi:AraC family transcriptional regulator of adaptative response/methylated-DNA-[protein]-cysteine methyltransferase